MHFTIVTPASASWSSNRTISVYRRSMTAGVASSRTRPISTSS